MWYFCLFLRYGGMPVNNWQINEGGAVMASKLKIVEGPGKFDFMVAVFKPGQNVSFTVMDPEDIRSRRDLVTVGIRSLRRLDHTADRWFIEGHVFSPSEPDPVSKYEAYYDFRGSKDSKGTFEKKPL